MQKKRNTGAAKQSSKIVVEFETGNDAPTSPATHSSSSSSSSSQLCSRNLLLTLLGVSLIGNCLQFNAYLNTAIIEPACLYQTDNAVARTQQYQKNNSDLMFRCPPCPSASPSSSESEQQAGPKTVNIDAESDDRKKGASASSSSSVGAAVDDSNVVPDLVASAPKDYNPHNLFSKFDDHSPVHRIINVDGIGPMIGVTTPIWSLVKKGSRGVSAGDDLYVPGKVVGTEKPQEEREAAGGGGDEAGGAADVGSGRKLQQHNSDNDEAKHHPSGNDLQLWVPKDTTRISIDVGTFITSPSSRRWRYFDEKLMVFAFEPNIVSGMLLSRISHPAFTTQMRGYWPSCPTMEKDPLTGAITHTGKPDRQAQLENLEICLNQSYGHITRYMDKFALFPVAISNRDHYANFQYGFPDRADSGSLLAFTNKLVRKRKGAKPLFALPTPVMKMSSILSLIPKTRVTDGSPILWDTLKIDAQGVDSLIIEGAGHLLKNFACILGEFDASGYRYSRKFDYKAYLVYELGFLMLKRTTFVNPAMADVVHSKKALCFASDVAVDYGQLGHVINKMKQEGRYPKQREHPELKPISRA